MIWTALAERSGDGALGRANGGRNGVKVRVREGGVALRFPPQSKTPIGTKFKPAAQGGPQGQPNVGQGRVSFYFGALPR